MGVAAAGTTWGPATIGWTGSSVIIAAVDNYPDGDYGDLDYWYQPAGTRPWNEQQVGVAAAGTTWGPATIGWTGSSVIIAAASSFGGLYYWYEPAGTTTWHEQYVGQDVAPDDDPSIAWTGSSVVIANMSGGDLEFWWQAAGTRPWHQEQVAALGTSGLAGPAMIAAPAAVLITAPDASGNLDLWWQLYGTVPWGEQRVAAG